MSAAEPIRCLTLWQPWASLLASGTKRYETRSWPTPYRGLLAIHAAKRWDSGTRASAEQIAWDLRYDERLAGGDGGLGHMAPSRERLARNRGCVVALARVASCERMTPDLIAEQSPLELRLGDWRPGRYAWRIDDAIALPDPIPLKGRQGMWTLPEDVAALVREQAGATP